MESAYGNKDPTNNHDRLYLRFIGDRSIQEKDFGRIQIDRITEMQKWAENIKNVQEHMNLAIVAANNHYAGFGPGTVNIFRNMIGLPKAKWEEKEMGIQKQEEQYPAHELRLANESVGTLMSSKFSGSIIFANTSSPVIVLGPGLHSVKGTGC